MESVAELRNYVADLEYRLNEYHEWLQQSVADRDRLALDAAWGVHAGVCSIAAYLGVFAAAVFGFGPDRWWTWGIAVVGGQVAATITYHWSNRHRLRELQRLAKLPEWTWKDPTWQ